MCWLSTWFYFDLVAVSDELESKKTDVVKERQTIVTPMGTGGLWERGKVKCPQGSRLRLRIIKWDGKLSNEQTDIRTLLIDCAFPTHLP